MSFGKRLHELRKAKKMSQTELGSEIGVHKNVLGKYERDEVRPSIDIALKIGIFFGVSLDFLVGKVDAQIDKSIAEKVLKIQKLSEKEQDYIMFALDNMIKGIKVGQIAKL